MEIAATQAFRHRRTWIEFASSLQPESLTMVFPAPFEDLGPDLNVAGSSSVTSASLRANPVATRAPLDKHGKPVRSKERRRASSGTDNLPKRKQIEWGFKAASTGGLDGETGLRRRQALC